MPRKPKPLNEQSVRFVRKAEEIGANATDDEFRRAFSKAVPPKVTSPSASPQPNKKRQKRSKRD